MTTSRLLNVLLACSKVPSLSLHLTPILSGVFSKQNFLSYRSLGFWCTKLSISDLVAFLAPFHCFYHLCCYHRFFSMPPPSGWETFHWAVLWTPWREHLQGPPTLNRLCMSCVPALMASSICLLLRKVQPAKQLVTFASGAENGKVDPPPRHMDKHSLKLMLAKTLNQHG